LDAAGALFDMIADPGQEKDIAVQQPDIAEKLRQSVSAWRKEVLADVGEDTRPFPVGYAEFPWAPLPARDGVAHGQIQRSASAPNSSYYRNWSNLDDSITWDIEVHIGGEYEALIYYTCPKEDIGSIVELNFQGSKIQGKVETAFDPPLMDTMDRVPRKGETYMKDFQPLRLGLFHLTKGRGLLTLRALKIPGKQVMDMRGVTLTLMK
jgi:hypothetical protein